MGGPSWAEPSINQSAPSGRVQLEGEARGAQIGRSAQAEGTVMAGQRAETGRRQRLAVAAACGLNEQRPALRYRALQQ
jgi:hypothetical protein